MLLSPRGESKQDRRRQFKKRMSSEQVKKRIRALKKKGELQLSDLFSDDDIHYFCEQLNHKFRCRIFTPAITLGLFVRQVLSRNESCSTIAIHLNRLRKNQGLTPVSSDASAYCKARSRLPIELIDLLIDKTSELVRDKIPGEWKWKGRDVFLVDGLVVAAPDTEENQAAYPQPSSQQEGLGFPQVRIVTTTSLATGCVLNYNTGTVEGKKTGEVSLFREKHGTFRENDIVIADSNFESFIDAVMLKARGVDLVCCMNGSRESPFEGPCETIEDETRRIHKPKYHADRFTREQWESLPAFLDVRIIRYRVNGRRSEITIVTTLLDRKSYPAEDVAELYGFRWDVELDIRSIKTVMGMRYLRCNLPENLDREIAVNVLAHNLVCWLKQDTAKVFRVHPRQISFSAARDTWIAFADELQTTNDLAWAISSAGCRFVRNRPGRDEPRKVKRRNAKYERLDKPRPSRIARMAAQQTPAA